MEMRIKRIYTRNVGPIDNADIEFCTNADKTPKPVILVGENGTGKSTILSNIVDAFYEMAGKTYKNVREQDGTGYQYYKTIKSSEIKIDHKYMSSIIEFCDTDSEKVVCRYVFMSGDFNCDEFIHAMGTDFKDKNIRRNNNLKTTDILKEDVEKIFNANVICYFGSDRFEKPQWLGEKYYRTMKSNDVHMAIKQRYSGNLYTPISVEDVTNETLQWLLDVIVDSRMDIVDVNGVAQAVHANLKEVLALGIARKNIENIMTAIIGKDVYFGLNFRSEYGSRFNIFDRQDEKVIVPSLDALSTGQSVLFNMFATIVRYADSKDINRSINCGEIEGIVVIDEIELHLHSKLQREVLPKLLKLFPKIQFVITTHSPLFLLGMDEAYGKDGYCIYQMPKAEIISSECFTEFQNAYLYMSQTEKFQSEIKNAIQNKNNKNLIVTEGATDWRHLKAALRYFQNHKAEYTDLDIEFLEYNPKNPERGELEELEQLEMSGTQLVTMCEGFSKIEQPRKIIFIADADVPDTVNKLFDKGKEYKIWKHNVYSMILPVPEHRADTPKICIEHYYLDCDLKREIEINGVKRRIYLGNEFNKHGLSNDKKLICTNKNSCGKNKINIIDGQSDKRVFDINDEEEETNFALPKMDFAEAIYTEKDEMKGIDFSAFRLVFDIIKKICDIDT